MGQSVGQTGGALLLGEIILVRTGVLDELGRSFESARAALYESSYCLLTQ